MLSYNKGESGEDSTNTTYMQLQLEIQVTSPLVHYIEYELFISADDRLHRDYDTPILIKEAAGDMFNSWDPVVKTPILDNIDTGATRTYGRVTVVRHVRVKVPRSSCTYRYVTVSARPLDARGRVIRELASGSPSNATYKLDALENNQLFSEAVGVRCSHFEFDVVLAKGSSANVPDARQGTANESEVLNGAYITILNPHAYPSSGSSNLSRNGHILVDYAYYLSPDTILDARDVPVYSSSIRYNNAAVGDVASSISVPDLPPFNDDAGDGGGELCGPHFLLLAVDTNNMYQECYENNNLLTWQRFTVCNNGWYIVIVMLTSVSLFLAWL